MFVNRRLLSNALLLSLVLSFLSGVGIFSLRLVSEFEQEKAIFHQEIEVRVKWILARYEATPVDSATLCEWLAEMMLREKGLHR